MLEVHRKEALSASLCGDLYAAAIRELPEFQDRPFVEAYCRIGRSIEANDRVEVIATHDGEIQGAVILVLEDDVHVGPCMSVHWGYVKPEHRGVGIALYRQALKLAKKLKAPYLAYSHRTGHMQYTTTYRRLNV